MTPYHLSYTAEQLTPQAINRIRVLIKQEQFFKQDSTTKLNLLKSLSSDLSFIYGIEDIKTIEILNFYWGVGGYNPEQHNIILNKPSLVTFLHEFGHHLFIMRQEENTEPKARGFSHSLYFQATPKLFESAINKSLLIHQKSMTAQHNNTY